MKWIFPNKAREAVEKKPETEIVVEGDLSEIAKQIHRFVKGDRRVDVYDYWSMKMLFDSEWDFLDGVKVGLTNSEARQRITRIQTMMRGMAELLGQEGYTVSIREVEQ